MSRAPCACGSAWTKPSGMCRRCHYSANPKETTCGHQPYWCGGLCSRCYEKRRHASHPDRIKNSTLRNKYGITIADVRALQADGCAICGSHKRLRGKDLHVDHDHSTGRFRGMLCHSCNVGLGNFGDDIERMKKAIAYLEREPPDTGRAEPWMRRRARA